ncbi:hypothetical protein PSTG_09988 [Puccinia striiformis f. sp. tritici PST-78]|uniref:DUF6589 domain-containing protein n=1 Tax=Puccinia striiformis f. sp. tritici PST-78 TaxID=1165861 RepID=A0A0L0VBM6_9BASI|nr:hypothetical protein PSTG_09988 [Puccinia striiformis f. sp. tritici PST-78]
MFHGTWGYVHMPPASLLQALDPGKLTIEVLNNALHGASKLTICPSMFTPTIESSEHWEATLKLQITRVILCYIAKPVDRRLTYQRLHRRGGGRLHRGNPAKRPDPGEFHSRLHIVEGDLGLCNLLETLKKQRAPAVGNHNSLHNVLPVPGAAHTLWNISQAIFLAHWGNKKCAHDTGAWRTLHALGVTAEKPVTKKDFNLMC